MYEGEIDGNPKVEIDVDLNDVPRVEGWHIEWQSTGDYEFPLVERNDKSEYFSLTNRPFEAIDDFITHKFIALILKKINENPGRKITVLDIGGGVLSRAVIDILRHPLLKGKVTVINVDPFAKQMTPEEIEEQGIEQGDLIIIPAEFAQCYLPDGCVDAAISYQVLNYMTDDHFKETIFKLARVLAPGGEAYLDNDGSLDRQRSIFYGVPVTYPRTFESSRTYRRDFQWFRNQGVYIDETCKEVSAIDEDAPIINQKPSRMIYMGKCSSYTFNGQQMVRYPTMNNFSSAWPQLGEISKNFS